MTPNYDVTMPPNYELLVEEGRGWTSFGWRCKEADGNLKIRRGLKSAQQAAGNAWREFNHPEEDEF